MIEAECPICGHEFQASAGAKCPSCGHANLIIKNEIADEQKDDPVSDDSEKAEETPS